MSPGKRPKAAPPSFRTEVTRRAVTLGVTPDDLERALIIGQIAGLLAKDPALKGEIAHKGAAMLHLVNLSQRLSRDLDSADIRGQRIDERAAEKVRAFLTRGEASDAYDLWWYANKVLTVSELLNLGPLIQTKLGRSRLGTGDVLERFDDMRDNAKAEWTTGTGLVIAGPKPAWAEVDKALARFKSVSPRRAHP